MADQGWSPDETPALRGGKAAGAFDTSGLRGALESNNNIANGNAHNGNTHRETPKPVDGWVPPTPYDYEALGGEAAHEWESNAVIYEWDGEEGDIGPEHPALEKQLFGEPGNRAVQGIDFSK